MTEVAPEQTDTPNGSGNATLEPPMEDEVSVVVGPPDPADAEQARARAAAAQVKGRINVEDEVVEKIAGLAAIDVPGVADLGGDLERAAEAVRDRIGLGARRGDQGVRAKIENKQVGIDVTIVIEYGHVVMEVAKAVKTNVAVSVNRMLGLRVVEVNVTVDDVAMPGPGPSLEKRPEEDEDEL
ncbi:MAG: Asp23/Gls24 family envelope stress response protein [Streptosporangiales bacterium]|nr:Asp23/Gls24 family envelope stress response protein [Streptosporangiales bacterium]